MRGLKRATAGDARAGSATAVQWMRFLCVALLGLPAAAGFGQVPPSSAAAATSLNRPLHVIPFKMSGNRIWLQVSGPGFGPRPFLLDSGAQSTHYVSELVERAGLRSSGRVGITGVGTQRIRGNYVAPTTLKIGSLSLPVRRGIAGRAEPLFGSFYSAIGGRFDGVIGYEFFEAFVVEIDYVDRRLRLYDPGNYRPPATTTIPIQLLKRKPYFEAILKVGDALIPANLHLDTGYGGAATLNASFVERHRLIERVGLTVRGAVGGVGGSTEARTTRLPAVGIGQFEIAAPIVTLGLVQGLGVRSDASGRIGGEFLRRFLVTINYRARTMTLVPNGSLAEPFEADMSGIALRMDHDGSIVVASAEEGSPAAKAGIRAGSRLLTLDGEPVSQLPLDVVRAALRQDGASRRLRVLRDGQEVEAEFTLRRRL